MNIENGGGAPLNQVWVTCTQAFLFPTFKRKRQIKAG